MKKSTSKAIGSLLGPLIFLGFAIQLVKEFWFIILAIIVVIAIVTIYNGIEIELEGKAIKESDVDSMDGITFEHYVKRLLERNGYSAKVTQASSDFGVDIIASKHQDRFAIQVKRYSSNVSRKAVSDAVAGMSYYNCNKSMVVTNSFFTKSTKEMANKTNTILIDRPELSKWIENYQNS